MRHRSRQTFIASVIRPLAVMIVACAMSAWAAESVLPEGWSRLWGKDPGATAAVATDEPAPGGSPVVRLFTPDNGSPITVRAVTMPITIPGGDLTAEMLVRSTQAGRMLTVCFYTDPRDGRHWYTTRLVPLTSSWVRQRVVVSAPTGAEWVGRPLYLHFSIAPGEALIAGASLARTVATAATPTTPGQRNLLANPGFDTGAGGWFLQAWPPQESTTELPRTITEHPDSGPFALRLPGGGVSVISTLVPFTPGRASTLSFSMRLAPGATRNGRAANCFLITPNWKIAQRAIAADELGDTWKRFSLVFREADQGSPHANAIYVRIDALATVDLDSVQVEDGDTPSAFTPGIQVGLEPPGDAGFLSPGAAELTAVIGLPEAASTARRLIVRGCASNGDELYQQQIDLPATGDTRRTVRIPVTHQREGVVACQLSVRDATGTLLATTEARYAVFAGEPPINPLLGMDDLPMREGLPLLRRSEAIGRRLGLGFRRSFFDLHAGDGPDPRMAYAHSAYSEQRQVAKRSMIVIDPAADSSFNLTRMAKLGHGPSEDEFVRDLPRFVTQFTTVAHGLDGVVDAIEMLNEPNIWTVKGVAMMPPERYVRLLAAIRPALRTAAPRMHLVLNVNGIDHAYVAAIAKLGGLKLVDEVTVHAYRANPEYAPIITDLARLRTLIDGFAPGMPITNSEQYYGLLDHGIGQGEYERSYCGDNEVDINGRTLQTILHGLTAGAPFAILTHGSGICMHTPFGAPWLYQSAGGMRAIARLAQGVTSGRDVPVHDSVRALQFTTGDGSYLVSVNARVFGEHGSMGRPAGCTVFDVDGNPLNQDEYAIGYLPLYLQFPRSMSADAVTKAVQAVAWRGFAFPVELTAARSTDGQVRVVAHNRERQAVKATVRWTGSATTTPWQLDLPAAGTAELLLPAGNPPWPSDPELTYEITCGDAIDAGRLRIPVLLIPRLEKVDLAAWEPTTWLDLDESHLSTDFAPERPHTGASDLAARVALAWSSNGLHLLARVTDNAVVAGPHHGSDAWNDDSLQLYVDQHAAARSPRALPDGGCTSWILGQNDVGNGFAWLDLAPTGRFVGGANATSGVDPVPVVAWRKTTAGWECRATFSPVALAALDFQAGSVFGLSLLINDNDGPGRKRGLTLGPAGTEPIGKPWLWKRCQLDR